MPKILILNPIVYAKISVIFQPYNDAVALLQPELSLLKILPVEFDRDAVIVSPEQDTHLSRKAPEP